MSRAAFYFTIKPGRITLDPIDFENSPLITPCIAAHSSMSGTNDRSLQEICWFLSTTREHEETPLFVFES